MKTLLQNFLTIATGKDFENTLFCNNKTKQNIFLKLSWDQLLIVSSTETLEAHSRVWISVHSIPPPLLPFLFLFYINFAPQG